MHFDTFLIQPVDRTFSLPYIHHDDHVFSKSTKILQLSGAIGAPSLVQCEPFSRVEFLDDGLGENQYAISVMTSHSFS